MELSASCQHVMNMAHRITCLEEGEGTMTRSPKIWTCKLLAGLLSNVYRIEVIVAELMLTASEQPRRVGERAPRTFSGMTCWTGRGQTLCDPQEQQRVPPVSLVQVQEDSLGKSAHPKYGVHLQLLAACNRTSHAPNRYFGLCCEIICHGSQSVSQGCLSYQASCANSLRYVMTPGAATTRNL